MGINDSLHDPHCSFKYAGFSLAAVYMILLIAVVRFFVKLVISKDHKRQAQKVFLGLVTVQCTIRMFFFFLWPILGPTCYPVLSARTFDWLIIPGDFPAALFLTAFGVLVITFARIYHIVLHGDVRSMRRFQYLIAGIILVNTGVYFTQVADWINSATGDQYPIFADVYPYVLAGAAFCTALQFLVYGTLLFFHVRKVLRHTGNGGNNTTAATNGTTKPVARLTVARAPLPPAAVAMNQNGSSASSTPQRVSIAAVGRPQVGGTPSGSSPSSNAPHRVLLSSVAQALQPSSPTHKPLTVGTIQVAGGHASNNSSPSGSPRSASSASRGHLTPRQPTRYSEAHQLVHHHPPPPELDDDENGSPRDVSVASPPIVVTHHSPRISNGSNSHVNNTGYQSIVRSHPPTPSPVVGDNNSNSSGDNAATATVTNGAARNPMRKVAQIAAICTMCLMARTILLPVMAHWFSDAQNPWITVIYFTTAELLPLTLMLRVFEAATDQSPMAGAGGRGGNAPAHTTDVAAAADGQYGDDRGSLVDPNDNQQDGGGYHSSHQQLQNGHGGHADQHDMTIQDEEDSAVSHAHHHQDHMMMDQPITVSVLDDHRQQLREPLLPADT